MACYIGMVWSRPSVAADRCTEAGAIGVLLRREGIYSSQLATWRRQRATRLVPLAVADHLCKLGALKGKIKVPDDFDAPLPAKALAAFEYR